MKSIIHPSHNIINKQPTMKNCPLPLILFLEFPKIEIPKIEIPKIEIPKIEMSKNQKTPKGPFSQVPSIGIL